MPVKLTDVFVAKLKPTSKVGFTFDVFATGLGLKVLPSGKKVWVLQTKFPGRPIQSKRSLGEYPGVTLAEARQRAAEWRELVKKGVDPAAVEAEERDRADAARREEARKAQNTFASVAESYIAERSKNRRAKGDAAEIRRMLIKEWGNKPIHDIAASDVRHTIEKIAKRAPYDARNAWTHAVGIFKQAVHVDLIKVSPCASLNKSSLFKNVTIEHRQRVLGGDEIFAFWRTTDRLGYPAAEFYKLLLLTGCRLSELADAQWSELHPEMRRLIREAAKAEKPVDWGAVSPDVKILTVPRERFKSNAEHVIQLPDAACAIIESLPEYCASLFTANQKTAVWIGYKYKSRLDRGMLRTLRALARKRGDDSKSVKLAPWINHDLRRVVRSNLAALNVDDHVAEMVLGHGRKGLQRIYDQHQYAPQIRAALEAWAARLHGIVTPAPATPTPADNSNVVKLRRA